MSPTRPTRLTHPAEIEREIQRQIAAASASRTKASLLNLVIFRQAFSRDPSAEALSYLLGRRPARLILVESGVDSPSEAFVSARCHPEPKNLELCFQEIRIQDGPDGVGRDPGFWSPLLIRDIPVYVWWLQSAGLLPEMMGGLAPLADRFMAYSGFAEERGEDPANTLHELAVWTRSGGLPCSDFSWLRIHPLRLNTARLFDPSSARELLEDIRSVRLQGGRRAESLLYFLWLAARLGWVPRRRKDGGLAASDAQGNEVRLLHEQAGALEAGFSLQIETGGRRRLGFECSGGGAADGPPCGQLTGPDGRTEHVGFRVPTAGEVLLREVDSHAPDPVFREVLDLFAAETFQGNGT
jgi:hypothetical protein